jgi:hypothetical protein
MRAFALIAIAFSISEIVTNKLKLPYFEGLNSSASIEKQNLLDRDKTSYTLLR